MVRYRTMVSRASISPASRIIDSLSLISTASRPATRLTSWMYWLSGSSSVSRLRSRTKRDASGAVPGMADGSSAPLWRVAARGWGAQGGASQKKPVGADLVAQPVLADELVEG